MQIGTDVTRLEATLRGGQVAIFPTDTVFGIGCRIDHEEAIKRVYEIKQRNYDQKLPVLLADLGWLSRYAVEVPGGIVNLIERFWPGPLTIALPVKLNSLLPILQNGRGSVSFRVPNFAPLLHVIRDIDVPIVGTSANFHGQPASPTSDQLDPNLMALGDYTFAGACGLGQESTVIEYTKDGLMIHREGSIPSATLAEISSYPLL